MTDASLARLLDEQAIRAVLDEYCLRLEVEDFASWLELFTEDTVYEVYRQVLNGKQEMAALLSQAPHGVHLPGATRITVDGDRAETIQNYAFISTGTDEWNAGWYWRELVRTRSGWKIARTVVQFARKDDLPSNDRARTLAYPIRFG